MRYMKHLSSCPASTSSTTTSMRPRGLRFNHIHNRMRQQQNQQNRTFKSLRKISNNAQYKNDSFCSTFQGFIQKNNVNSIKLKSKPQIRQYSVDTSDFQEITMPALSPTMEKGNISKWRVKEGDKIEGGDVICEIETDKATLEFEAPEDGYVGKILTPEGTKDVPVGQLIALFTDTKDDIAKAQSYEPSAESGEKSSQPAQQSEKEESGPSASAAIDVDVMEIGMPALSPTMEKGNISKWNVQVGDKVESGDIICEIETDKATLEFESPEDGIVGKILKPEGSSEVPVGEVIAVLVDEEGDVEKVKNYQPGAKDAPSDESAAKSEQQPKEETKQKEEKQPPKQQQQQPSSKPAGVDRVFASPYARKLARDNGIDINEVDLASGPNGRIIAEDVEQYLKRPKREEAAPKPKEAIREAVSAAQPSGEYEEVPTSNVRQVIAERLQESKRNIPHYYLSVDIRMDELIALRKRLNDQANGEYKVSVNDFIVKASAIAMRDVPEANSSWRGDSIRKYKNVDVCVAVQTDYGLITPIVRNTERLGVREISEKVKDLAQRARENKLSPEEYQGGTFTVSNLGMFGIKNFSAIINPPQSCILAVGAAETRVIPKNKTVEGDEAPYEFGNFMSVTLSCDHRVVDGAVGAGWLKAFRKYIEDPMTMLL